jgi:hypothetical protein
VEIRKACAIGVLVCACGGMPPTGSPRPSCADLGTSSAAPGRTLVWLEDRALGVVADADNARVVVFRVGARAGIVQTISTREGPAQVLASGDRWIVVERGAGTVSAYDACTGRRLASEAVAADPVAMVMGPEGESR